MAELPSTTGQWSAFGRVMPGGRPAPIEHEVSVDAPQAPVQHDLPPAPEETPKAPASIFDTLVGERGVPELLIGPMDVTTALAIARTAFLEEHPARNTTSAEYLVPVDPRGIASQTGRPPALSKGGLMIEHDRLTEQPRHPALPHLGALAIVAGMPPKASYKAFRRDNAKPTKPSMVSSGFDVDKGSKA